MKYIPFLLAFFVLTVAGCQTTSDAGEPVEEVLEEAGEMANELNTNNPKKGVMSDSLLGTIRYLELEGGFYGIVGEDGKNYLPLNLDEAFEQDSLQVRFTYQRREGVMTIAMWGQAVDITSIERVE